jgi:hypothetical protein
MIERNEGREDFVELREACAELLIEPRKAVRLSRLGKFPPLLRVTSRHYLIRRSDLAQWKAGRWTTAEQARAAIVLEAVRGEVVNRRRRQHGGALAAHAAWGHQ